ncbi:MAG: hypothetical protein U9O59_05240 [Actinomycetota bacterium]|nr:hypothetical protein [Actinomycetota bacterium]
MNRREKLKNIFSWISIGSSVSSFLFVFISTLGIFNVISKRLSDWSPKNFLHIFIYIACKLKWDWFLPYGIVFLIISIIAISSGIYGVWGDTRRGIKIRSYIGLILGHLCYGLIFPLIIIKLDF